MYPSYVHINRYHHNIIEQYIYIHYKKDRVTCMHNTNDKVAARMPASTRESPTSAVSKSRTIFITTTSIESESIASNEDDDESMASNEDDDESMASNEDDDESMASNDDDDESMASNDDDDDIPAVASCDACDTYWLRLFVVMLRDVDSPDVEKQEVLIVAVVWPSEEVGLVAVVWPSEEGGDSSTYELTD